MRKILMLFCGIVLITFSTFAFSVEPDEEEVMLTDILSAVDNFDEYGNQIWTFSSSDDFYEYYSNGYGLYKGNDSDSDEAFAYINYDFNSGRLKSDYYRFVTEVNIGGNESWSGFVINDSNDFKNNDTYKVSIVKYKDKWKKENKQWIYKNQYKYGFEGKTKKLNITDDYTDVVSYEIIMRRQGESNNFDVTINVYRHDILLFSKDETDIEFTSIYPALWVDSYKRGQYLSFAAYHKPESNDSVTLSELYQDGNEIKFDWSIVGGTPESVKLYYSEDNIIDNNSDTLINYDASKRIAITDDMKSDGYFGVVGYDNGDYGEPSISRFQYLPNVENFYYVPTSVPNTYKFVWTSLLGAERYAINYNGSTTWFTSERNTVTLSDVSNPDSVSIYAKKQSGVSAADSMNETVFATAGDLEAVKNFSGYILNNQVVLSWSDYLEASNYILYKNNGYGEYLELKNDLVAETYSDPLTSDFLRLNYKINAIVAGEKSLDSNIVSLGNKVKNLTAEFNDGTSQVEVTWDGINQANKYRVYKSVNEDMSGATYVEVDTNAYAFAFDKNDKVNKYIQVEAMYLDEETPSNNIYSDITDVLTIDYSRNNAVTGIVPTYVANTYEVDLKWDVLTGATAYNILIGDSPTNLNVVDTVVDENYTYRIKNTDKNKLYFAVQGVSASQNFVQSTPVSIDTFMKDLVENLSVNYNGGTKKAEVRWSSLLRASKYILTAGVNSYEVAGNTMELDNVALGTGFSVKGVKLEDDVAVYSQSSNTVTAVDVEYDIQISAKDGFSNKTYGKPMELDMDIVINKEAVNLNSVVLEFDLNNVFKPNSDEIIASYIYPEIISVEVTDASNVEYNVDYLTTVKTGRIVNGTVNADGGYMVRIVIPDTVDNHIATGSTVKVKLKSDLRFNNLSGDVNSILYVDPTTAYAQMELPFHVEGRIAALENRLGLGAFIQDAARVDVIMSYKTSTDVAATTYTKYQLINYSFKDKELIIGE